MVVSIQVHKDKYVVILTREHHSAAQHQKLTILYQYQKVAN